MSKAHFMLNKFSFLLLSFILINFPINALAQETNKQVRKAQSIRKASIAAGVLRRMMVDHGEQLFLLVF